LNPGQIRDALVNAQAIFTAPKNHDASAAKRHVSTAVVGTRGGVGASTLATSLAWLFSTDHRSPTALLDLDVHFGTGALTLDLEPGRGLSDAIDNPSRIDGLFIERAMIRANDNLAILSAEAPINSPLMTDGSAFVQLEEEFRQAFEMNVVILATELTLAGARDAIRLLSWLKSNAAHARPIIVANKVQPSATEISKADFEASIERKINFMIPYDIKAASNAAKLGQTFVAANRATKAGGVLRDVAQAIIGSVDEDGATAADNGSDSRKASLLGKFDLKKMLASKPKAKTAAKV
jgi:pilus assembly protein CpaE